MAENEEKRDRETPDEEEIQSNAARRLKISGDAAEDPIHEGKAEKGSFWGNFWYHYRGRVLVICAFVLIFGIGITQFILKKRPDIYIMYAGPVAFDNVKTEKAEQIFGELVGDDYNNNGKKEVRFATVFYVSDDNVERDIDRQIAEAEEKGEEVHERDFYYHTYLAEYKNSQENHRQYENFSNEIFAGDSVVVLLDPALFETVKASGGFMKLSEVFGYTPEGAIDEYGVRFSETAIAQYYGVFSSLPDDTVLAVRQVSTMSAFTGKKKAQKAHDDHVAFARALLSFTPPEDTESGDK